jgi:hypothetical protein
MRGALYSNDAIQGEKLTIKIVDAGGEISSFYVNPNLRRVLRRWDTRHKGGMNFVSNPGGGCPNTYRQ